MIWQYSFELEKLAIKRWRGGFIDHTVWSIPGQCIGRIGFSFCIFSSTILSVQIKYLACLTFFSSNIGRNILAWVRLRRASRLNPSQNFITVLKKTPLFTNILITLLDYNIFETRHHPTPQAGNRDLDAMTPSS